MRANALAKLLVCAGLCAVAAATGPSRAQPDADLADRSGAAALVTHAAGEAISARGRRSDRDDAIARLRDCVEEDFNVRYVGLLALGTHRRSFDAEMLEAFEAAFPDYLAARFGALLEGSGAAELRIVGVEPAGVRDALVSTLIEGRGTHAEWRVRLFSGRPQLIDVSVEGTSLVGLQRAEIDQWIKEAGAKGLIARLQAAAGGS